MLSDINLILQIGILVTLTIGIAYVKRVKFNVHGYLMFVAVALNVPSIISVMLPSALRILDGASLNAFTSIVMIHSLLGVIVIGLGIYILVVWRFKRPGGSCFKSKRLMRTLAPLWVVSVVSGAIMYFLLYY